MIAFSICMLRLHFLCAFVVPSLPHPVYYYFYPFLYGFYCSVIYIFLFWGCNGLCFPAHLLGYGGQGWGNQGGYGGYGYDQGGYGGTQSEVLVASMLGFKLKLILMHLLEKLLSCSSGLSLFNRAVIRMQVIQVFLFILKERNLLMLEK